MDDRVTAAARQPHSKRSTRGASEAPTPGIARDTAPPSPRAGAPYNAGASAAFSTPPASRGTIDAYYDRPEMQHVPRFY